MRSLRRSLTLYFLFIAAGVVAVAFVADRIISESLHQKAEANTEAIRLRQQERESTAREKFDRELLDAARARGAVIQGQYQQMVIAEWQSAKPPVMAMSVSMFSARNPMNGILSLLVSNPAYFPPDRRGRSGGVGIYFQHIGRGYFKNLPLPDQLYLRESDGERHTRYIQVNSTSGGVWRTPELDHTVFPLNSLSGKSEQVIDWAFDEVVLPMNTIGRRVVLKTTIGDRWSWSPIPRGGPRPGGPGPGGDRGGPPPFPPPPQQPGGNEPPRIAAVQPMPDQPPPPPPQRAVFIHVAVPMDELNAQLTGIQQESELERVALAALIESDRSRFRAGIAGMGLATVLIIVLGGPILIHRGLAPIHKLSNAVAQVSEKDFELSVRPEELTRELLPIYAGLTETLDALKRAFAREKQAVGDISHELRTPLAGLLASMEVALRKPRTADSYKATLEECRIIAKELSRLVERILTLAAIDSGRAHIHLAPLDTFEIADTCANVIRPLVGAHDLKFEFDAEPGVELVTDADKLRDVLMNLLHNAIEYNRPGGTVRLAMSSTDSDVTFEVTDTGIGMTPEIRDHIFERFFRADASRHATGVHAGLGLSLVKEYVDRLGGTIAVSSEPDSGSTFRVTFPVNAPDPASDDLPETYADEPATLHP